MFYNEVLYEPVTKTTLYYYDDILIIMIIEH